jgi:hypothetical protein
MPKAQMTLANLLLHFMIDVFAIGMSLNSRWKMLVEKGELKKGWRVHSIESHHGSLFEPTTGDKELKKSALPLSSSEKPHSKECTAPP